MAQKKYLLGILVYLYAVIIKEPQGIVIDLEHLKSFFSSSHNKVALWLPRKTFLELPKVGLV